MFPFQQITPNNLPGSGISLSHNIPGAPLLAQLQHPVIGGDLGKPSLNYEITIDLANFQGQAQGVDTFQSQLLQQEQQLLQGTGISTGLSQNIGGTGGVGGFNVFGLLFQLLPFILSIFQLGNQQGPIGLPRRRRPRRRRPTPRRRRPLPPSERPPRRLETNQTTDRTMGNDPINDMDRDDHMDHDHHDHMHD